MTAQYVTSSLSDAQKYLKAGWTIKDYDVKIATAEMPNVNMGKISDYDTLKSVIEDLKMTVRTFILEFQNATRHTITRRPFSSGRDEISICNGCEDCQYTGWVKEEKKKK